MEFLWGIFGKLMGFRCQPPKKAFAMGRLEQWPQDWGFKFSRKTVAPHQARSTVGKPCKHGLAKVMRMVFVICIELFQIFLWKTGTLQIRTKKLYPFEIPMDLHGDEAKHSWWIFFSIMIIKTSTLQ